MNKFLKSYPNQVIFSGLLAIVILKIFLLLFISYFVSPVTYLSYNFFFLELLGISYPLPTASIIIFDFINIFLIWLISLLILNKKYSLVAPLIYVATAWASYLTLAGSFYIYLLFLTLVIYLLLIIYIKTKKILFAIALSLMVILSIYSCFFMFLILPIMIGLYILRLLNFDELKPFIVLTTLLILPLVFIIFTHQLALKNIITREIALFSDPGLINSVNDFQGEAKKEGYIYLSKISENKYFYIGKYLIYKSIKQLVPSTYFTAQEKLLNYSFSPPLYIGFLPIFLYGLIKLFYFKIYRKILLLFIILIVPSLFSKQLVDLNRLVLISPIIILASSYGIITLINKRKNKILFSALIISIVIVIFQFLITLSDIYLREYIRQSQYINQNVDLGHQ